MYVHQRVAVPDEKIVYIEYVLYCHRGGLRPAGLYYDHLKQIGLEGTRDWEEIPIPLFPHSTKNRF